MSVDSASRKDPLSAECSAGAANAAGCVVSAVNDPGEMPLVSSAQGGASPPVVRSFVLRKGRITKAQIRALDTLLPRYSIPAGERIEAGGDGGRARHAPLWLEIGFGNGALLSQLAQHHDGRDFIGAEVYRPGVGQLLQAIEQHGLKNVRLVVDDAVHFLQRQVADGALQRILLLFPDPWHKLRHHKRRIVNPAFAQLLAAKLEPGGVFHAATDWWDYAEHMRVLLDSQPLLENIGERADGYAEPPDYRIETRFEQRGRDLGHGVWDLLYRRAGLVEGTPESVAP